MFSGIAVMPQAFALMNNDKDRIINMIMEDNFHGLPQLEAAEHTYIGRDGVREKRSEEVLREHLMEVYINGELTMKLVCIPQDLAELVLGRLLTEGIIRSAADVERILICEYGKTAVVTLIGSEREQTTAKTESFVETTPTCCTGNHILNDLFLMDKSLRPVVPIPWKAAHVFALADRFGEGMPLHAKTWATHSCFLARGEELLFACEDIGRHNALDKVIGYALRSGIPLDECLVYSSGRIPTDMAMKAIRAGIPILCSKASPTREAVALAEKYRLTLICAARRDRMKLYAGELPQDCADKGV